MAVVLGTSSGFVTTAPTVDPQGADVAIDGASVVTKHTSPAGAYRVISIGWHRATGTNTANYELGIYADSDGVAGALIAVDNTNSSSAPIWEAATVDWSITQNTAYWLALQMDSHPGTTYVDAATTGGVGYDRLTSQTTLNDPYGGGAVDSDTGMYAVYALVRTAILTGTITNDTETEIVTGGSTIILTLTNDTWVADGATFEDQRQNIINGLTSSGAEATGWNNVVKAGLAVTTVVRTSATVVTITLSAFATYNITATETITVTIPATALTGAAVAIVSPTFSITTAVTSVVKDMIGGFIPFPR